MKSTVQECAPQLSAVLASAVFVGDLITPLGVASGVPYSLTVLLGLNSPSKRFVVGLAIACSLLTIAGFFIGSGRGGSELWKVLTNRSLALFMIWMTLILGRARKRADQRRREAEARTRQHLADLARMNRVETAGQLAAVLAHELNQPLAAISFQSEIARELLQRNDDPEEGLCEALQEVTEQSHRAAGIIQSLRGLFRRSEPEQKPLPLLDVVHEVKRLVTPECERRGVELQLELSEAPVVWGDSIQLQQVLLNLIQNSLDAFNGLESERLIEIESSRETPDRVTLSVHDTGRGIPDDQREFVFDRFRTFKPGGIGMGLAISRSIVEAHGGQLWTEPREEGATFRFSLPERSM